MPNMPKKITVKKVKKGVVGMLIGMPFQDEVNVGTQEVSDCTHTNAQEVNGIVSCKGCGKLM